MPSRGSHEHANSDLDFTWINPIAADELLCLREGPVGHRALSSSKRDARTLRAWVQPVECEQHAGLGQRLVSIMNRMVRSPFGEVARLDRRGPPPLLRRTTPAEIDMPRRLPPPLCKRPEPRFN
jgi:hypothetical protein